MKKLAHYFEEYHEPYEFLVLEPEDWSEDEWKTILKLFGMEEADRIVISDFTIQAYGVKKESEGET